MARTADRENSVTPCTETEDDRSPNRQRNAPFTDSSTTWLDSPSSAPLLQRNSDVFSRRGLPIEGSIASRGRSAPGLRQAARTAIDKGQRHGDGDDVEKGVGVGHLPARRSTISPASHAGMYGMKTGARRGRPRVLKPRSSQAARRASGPPDRLAKMVVVTVPMLLPRVAAIAARTGRTPASARPTKRLVTAELLWTTAVNSAPAASDAPSLA